MLYKNAFVRGAQLFPDKECIVDGNRRFTFKQVVERWNRFSNGLISLGVKKGDCVGTILKNSTELLDVYGASAVMGVVACGVNIRLPAEGIKAVLKDQKCTALLVGHEFIDVINSVRNDLPFVKAFISVGVEAPGYVEYNTLLERSTSIEPDVSFSPDDPAVLIYTTGTTGIPKGAMSTRQIQLYRMLSNTSHLNVQETDRYICAMPLFHIAAVVALGFTMKGATLVLQRDWDPKEFCRLVQDEKGTKTTLAPALIHFVVTWPDMNKYDLSTLNLILYGAAPITLETLKTAMSKLPGCEFIQAFGSAEVYTSVMLTQKDHRTAYEGTGEEQKRLRSCGRPSLLSFAKVINKEGVPVKPGEVGEVLISGGMVFKEYWNNPEETSKTLKDGWCYMGDLATMDEQGYIFIVDRKNFMIITGGENVYPNQVENCLFSHPKIAHAAVLGVPDPAWGENVKAVVVLKPGTTATEKEIIDFCRDKIASYAKPKIVQFVKEIPMTPMGKVDKMALKERYGNPE